MKPSTKQAFDDLCAHARETATLASLQALAEWDERAYLPRTAGDYRAEQVTLLARLVHQRRTDPRIGDWLRQLADTSPVEDPHSDWAATIRQTRREYDKLVKLPPSLVEELTRTAVRGQQIWDDARANNDFAAFAPILEKLVALKQQQADALGYETCRYDALLDEYEPGETTANVSQVLRGLRNRLVPLVAAIAESGKSAPVELLHRAYPGRPAVVRQGGGVPDRFRFSAGGWTSRLTLSVPAWDLTTAELRRATTSSFFRARFWDPARSGTRNV